MVESIESAARAWLEEDPDAATRAELEALMSDPDALAERFGGRLQFGTAGIRGVVGAGPMRMNRVMVRRVSAGLADYVIANVADAKTRGIVIGYDARTNSREFAEDAARVFLGKGIAVYLATSLFATPTTAFAVTDRGAAAGVMVTASHNPPEYNGYKVYWENGAQIIPPHDAGISAAIDAVGSTTALALPDLDTCRADGLLVDLGDDVVDRYLAGVRALAPNVEPAQAADVVIAYTPLHGVGARFVEAALADAGFGAVHTEASQREPDGAFPTVAFPNPEEEGAMDAVLALGGQCGADLVLANDPDADRLAVAIPHRDGSGYQMLTGDQIGVLLADYLIERGGDDARMVAATIVSSQLLGVMADKLGIEYRETLTGFKWIANAALATDARFVMGYEEALGYCIGDLVRDKDGVSAATTFAELCAYARARGETIGDRLERIYRRFGLFLTQQKSLVLPGQLDKIAALMTRFRQSPPAHIGGFAVSEFVDLAAPAAKPVPTNALIFRLEGGRRVIMRPSGTEPKLKSYYEVREPVAEGEAVSAAVGRAEVSLAALRDAHQALLDG